MDESTKITYFSAKNDIFETLQFLAPKFKYLINIVFGVKIQIFDKFSFGVKFQIFEKYFFFCVKIKIFEKYIFWYWSFKDFEQPEFVDQKYTFGTLCRWEWETIRVIALILRMHSNYDAIRVLQ